MAGEFDGEYHYVPNGFVYLWEQAGWKALPALNGTGHGLYSTLCKWEGEGDPVFPMNDHDEEWRPVVGFEGDYEVSSLGRVRSLDRTLYKPGAANGYPKNVKGVILKPAATPTGYLFVGVSPSGGGKKQKRYVAHLVAEAFIGPRPQGDIHVAHGDGDKANNRPSNLRYATRLENESDKDVHGTRSRGEQCNLSKLTAKEVGQIRDLAGKMTQQEIADKFGVAQSNVSMILSKQTWAA